MDLRKLDDDELEKGLEKSAKEEREATTRVLHHLLEADRRRLYAARGYSSLFSYTVKKF